MNYSEFITRILPSIILLVEEILGPKTGKQKLAMVASLAATILKALAEKGMVPEGDAHDPLMLLSAIDGTIKEMNSRGLLGVQSGPIRIPLTSLLSPEMDKDEEKRRLTANKLIEDEAFRAKHLGASARSAVRSAPDPKSIVPQPVQETEQPAEPTQQISPSLAEKLAEDDELRESYTGGAHTNYPKSSELSEPVKSSEIDFSSFKL